MDISSHWTEVYRNKPATGVTWYQKCPSLSLNFIYETGFGCAAAIIDVGAGSSTLADYLLEGGYKNITLLDISEHALGITRDRVREPDKILWMVGDITEIALPAKCYDIWHDRAVFHFLTDTESQRRYVEQIRHALKPSGHLIIATFASDGPVKCSGLDTVRYDPAKLHGVLGAEFELIGSATEAHVTPWNSEQNFQYCHFRFRGA